jgi:hypothetical protein
MRLSEAGGFEETDTFLRSFASTDVFYVAILKAYFFRETYSCVTSGESFLN